MTDLTRDPIINAIQKGIKGGIRVTLEDQCLGSAETLILSGMDTMAYLNMPANQEDVTRAEFVKWAERYVKFPCKEQLTGLDLYGARCAMLHSFGIASKLSRQGKCRRIIYTDKDSPQVRFAPAVAKDIVMVSITALADAFFTGVDQFLIDLFANKDKALIAEQRLETLVQAIPFAPNQSDLKDDSSQ